MRVIEDVRLAEETFPGVVLTIGSFDGVHLGHRLILDRLVGEARKRGGTAALMTLRPHPRQFFAPSHAPNILTQPVKKAELLKAHGVDVLYVLPFNAEVAGLDRDAFLREIVIGRCHAKKLIVGHDFAFGKGASGNFDYLRQVGPELGLEVEQVTPLILEGERVSSTLIRERVLQGDLEQAERLLGRKYSVLGTVKRGRGIGATLGFATANMEPEDSAIPMHGVYVGEGLVRGRRLAAAINVGIAPTIRHEHAMVEAHLLDFSEDIAGESLEVVFHLRLRPEARYATRQELVEAIARDVAAVRAYFVAPNSEQSSPTPDDNV